MSCALLDTGVEATVDNSCDDANMQYAEWWLPVETVMCFLHLFFWKKDNAHYDAKNVYE